MNSAGYGMIGAVVKGSLLTLALFLLYSTIPLLGAFAGVLVPFPCIYYSLKYGRVIGYAIVLMMVLFLAVLNQYSLFPYLILGGICSLVLPEFLGRGQGSTQALFLTVGLNACLAAGFTLAAITLFNVDVDAQVRRIIHEAMIQVGETYRQSGISGKELQALEDGLKLFENSFVKLYPSFVIILFWVIAGINVVLLKKVSVSLGKEISFDSFTQYRNPDSLVWLLILAGFTLLVDNPVLSNIAQNVLFLLYFLYLVQGLAICGWISKKKKFPRALQVVFFVLLAVQPLLTAIVAVFGLTDLWASFRMQKNNENL
jgi:uncharacterized protein YybS (DUF2232 family)